MGGQNTYLTYKRETAELLYWVIQAFNTIVQKTGAKDEDGLSLRNTTGKTTVQGLVSMVRLHNFCWRGAAQGLITAPQAKLIAENIGEQTVPPIVYQLFRSVIKARQATYEAFQQLGAQSSDPEVRKSNASHKHFIDALKEALKLLGGESEPARKNADADPSHDAHAVESNIILLANKFASLYLGAAGDEAHDDEGGVSDASDGPDVVVAAKKAPKKSFSKAKGKKGKRGKKPKQKQAKAAAKEPAIVDVPIESYRIIEDQEGIVTDYLMATYALAEEWVQLRNSMQKTWRNVAYKGLNSAVAGTLGNVAVSMLKRSELAMHVDFPGHDSFHTVVNTLTRGDADKIQGNFQLQLLEVDSTTGARKIEKTALDVKEQFMIHTYNDLLDFVVDFQKTRSGKPTKSMLVEIKNWDPDFDLQRATPEQRLKWRRSYTINWLYDLVNVFSAIVVQRNTLKGQNWALEKVDWSVTGPWNKHRRLFGLNEFAGLVTSLAMQKQGTDVRNKIPPHLVFQLQCIVDSLMVSRGFYTSIFRGHVMQPPASQFRPRRDVDLFLDREQERTGRGFLQGVHVLEQLFERDAMMNGNPNRHTEHMELIKIAQEDFRDWLGESKYMHGLNTIPPSRFSKTHTNGLWEYSPYLCGVGLMEGLELSYLYGMMIWDRTPEAFLLIHLHNMLVEKGYITQPVGLYITLQDLFADAFFVNGIAPTSNFQEALVARINENSGRAKAAAHHATRRSMAQANDIHGILDVKGNRYYQKPSTLVSFRKAYWNYERIPSSELSPTSILAMLRLADTEIVLDPKTDMPRLADTELTTRLRADGIDEQLLLQMAWSGRQVTRDQFDDPAELAKFATMMDPDYTPQDGRLPPLSASLKTGAPTKADNSSSNSSSARGVSPEMKSADILTYLEFDIRADVCGHEPRSSLNYMWTTACMHIQFGMMEDELRKRLNPMYVRAYETDKFMMGDKRSSFTAMAISGDDEECLRIMADCFQAHRVGFMQNIYWDDLEVGETPEDGGIRDMKNLEQDFENPVDGICSIM